MESVSLETGYLRHMRPLTMWLQHSLGPSKWISGIALNIESMWVKLGTNRTRVLISFCVLHYGFHLSLCLVSLFGLVADVSFYVGC